MRASLHAPYAYSALQICSSLGALLFAQANSREVFNGDWSMHHIYAKAQKVGFYFFYYKIEKIPLI